MGTPTLSLDGVEKGELLLIETLKGTVPQGRHRQRLQVQELGWRWVLLWEDQVSEGHRQLRLTGCREGQAELHLGPLHLAEPRQMKGPEALLSTPFGNGEGTTHKASGQTPLG